MLLAVAAGSLIAMPLAGIVVTKIGAARSVAIMSLILSVGLVVVAVGYWYGIPPIVAGLFLIGFGNGTWDVAMNVEGAAVEQRLGRAIMPKFHAGFSVGTVAGALGGVAMVALGVPVTAHLIGVAVIIAGLVPVSVRVFCPGRLRAPRVSPRAPREAHGTNPHPLRAWTEPRTLLIGVFVLCMAFTEGTGNDWLAVAVIDGYERRAGAGAAGARGLPGRHDRRPLVRSRADRPLRPGRGVRVSALIALVGLLLVVFGHCCRSPSSDPYFSVSAPPWVSRSA